MPIAAARVKEIFIECVNEYCNEYATSVTQDEGLTLLKYTDGNKYDYHADGEWSIYRTVSGIIYLNPQDYVGGETHFKLFDLNLKPESPSIALFPSNYAYMHAAMPVKSGTKYIFVTWMNDMPHGFSTRILSDLAMITGK
jgi:predicted 2-oxoglutarate/Fe(II)-dependent dioxygenase YbiX